MLNILLFFCIVVARVASKSHQTTLSHGWDCVACETNSMIFADFSPGRLDFEDQDWYTIPVISLDLHRFL